MGNERVYNFSAGPSMLPLEVLERAGAEITNYQGSGMSVMEMSHRSKVCLLYTSLVQLCQLARERDLPLAAERIAQVAERAQQLVRCV